MAILKRKQTSDILILQAVRYENEKLPRGKVRLLYVDTRGNCFASLVKRSLYDAARKNAAKLDASRSPYATIGIASRAGDYKPVVVAISHEEAWVLQRIAENVLTLGKVPDVLKKYISPIIAYGCDAHKALAGPQPKQDRRSGPATPGVLERLPYYPNHSTEVSIPIYKARYTPPLIVLKRLNPDETTPAGQQRLLVLDSDGDMAVIMVPTMIFRKLELELIDGSRKTNRLTRAVLEPEGNSFKASSLPVTREQQRSLETLVRHYEQTGNTRRHVSVAVKSVLMRAQR